MTSHCCPCCFRELGMFKESEHMLKEALGTSTKLYGKESIVVAEVLNHLGFTYYILCQLQKSRYANNLNKHSSKVVFCSQTNQLHHHMEGKIYITPCKVLLSSIQSHIFFCLLYVKHSIKWLFQFCYGYSTVIHLAKLMVFKWGDNRNKYCMKGADTPKSLWVLLNLQ